MIRRGQNVLYLPLRKVMPPDMTLGWIRWDDENPLVGANNKNNHIQQQRVSSALGGGGVLPKKVE